MVRVVLLGSTGFVGTAILHALQSRGSQAQVRALARGAGRIRMPGVEVIEGDIESLPEKLFFSEPHVVVHFATKQIDSDGSGFERTNVEGTKRLMSRLPASCLGVIYGSSASVYGQGAQSGLREDHP